MTYKELLDRYEKGKLDQDQRHLVEAEVEKHAAIRDYLWEQEEIPGLEAAPSDNLPEAADFTDAIRKTIHRTFVRLGLVVGLSVLVLTLCALFVLPRVVDEFYYKPDEIVARDSQDPSLTTSRMSLDLSVWTELFLPGKFRDNVTAIPRGCGVYDIAIHQNLSIDGRFHSVGGTLTRNELQLYDLDFLNPPVANAFLLPEGKEISSSTSVLDVDTGEETPVSRQQERQWAFDALRNTPETGLLQAYVSLETLMDYDDFLAWYEAQALNVYDLWAGIYAEDAYGLWATENTGVRMFGGGLCFSWDRERYPLLRPDSAGPQNKADMTTHFCSLMQYVIDNRDAMKLFGSTFYRLDPAAAMAYVEQHGLQIYGFSVTATHDELLKLEDNPAISYIRTSPY